MPLSSESLTFFILLNSLTGAINSASSNLSPTFILLFSIVTSIPSTVTFSLSGTFSFFGVSFSGADTSLVSVVFSTAAPSSFTPQLKIKNIVIAAIINFFMQILPMYLYIQIKTII